MAFLKHIGRLKDSDTKVIVVFMEIPNDEKFALVTNIDTLPDQLRDEVNELIQTPECQSEQVLGNFLKRKTFRAIGGGLSALDFLHGNGRLLRVPTSSVIMTPAPTTRILLSDLNDQMRELTREEKKTKNLKTTPAAQQPLISSETTISEKEAIANNLLAEAEDLRNAAELKETQAQALLKSVKPKKLTESKPKKTTEKK